MTLKRIVNLNEGPLDYARGLVGGIASAPQRARQTSATADLVKAIKVLAQLINRAGAQPEQQPPRQQYNTLGATTVPGQPDNKPTRPQVTFSSFVQQVSGEQLNEGIWDFVKGAGAHIRDQAIDKINKYAEGPSWLRDVIQSGKSAHNAAEIKRAGQQIAIQVKKIQQMIQQLGGGNPQKTLQRAVQMAGLSTEDARGVIAAVMGQKQQPAKPQPSVRTSWTQGATPQPQQQPQPGRKHGPAKRRPRPTTP